MIDNGLIIPRPQRPNAFFAKRYWGLPDDAILQDVAPVVRADHGYANELDGLPVRPAARGPAHGRTAKADLPIIKSGRIRLFACAQIPARLNQSA